MSPRPNLDRRTLLTGSLGVAAALVAGCGSGRPDRTAAPAASPSPTSEPSASTPTPSASPSPEPTPTPADSPAPADPATMATRATVPVLCYHQLRDWLPSDGAYARRLLICPPATFRAQLDALAQDGWTTISPDQYVEHLATGAALPDKPVMLTFDDSQATQVSEGLPQLSQRGMTAAFFVMTVVLGKPNWMSLDDLRRLADAGMTVGAHTYDHHRVDRYADGDWQLQLVAPRELLQEVVGRPVDHFAYPFGAWAPSGFEHLRAAGYTTAFQLSDDALDPTAPLLTLRRMLVDSTWTGEDLLRQVRGPV